MEQPAQVVDCLKDLVIEPRKKAIKWSKITRQTPNLKLAYPSQHIVSLFTGINGTGTAARGDDLVDGSEIKTCSLIDQLDVCKKCKTKVMRYENTCISCGSSEITRKKDSNWIIPIRSEADLLKIKEKDIYFVLYDYLHGDFNDIICSVYKVSGEVLAHELGMYYERMFTQIPDMMKPFHTEKYAAPKNLYPYSKEFESLSPDLIGEILVINASDEPKYYFLFK